MKPSLSFITQVSLCFLYLLRETWPIVSSVYCYVYVVNFTVIDMVCRGDRDVVSVDSKVPLAKRGPLHTQPGHTISRASVSSPIQISIYPFEFLDPRFSINLQGLMYVFALVSRPSYVAPLSLNTIKTFLLSRGPFLPSE